MMESIGGVSLKKIVELALAIVAVVLLLVGDSTNMNFYYFLIVCITLTYLALIVVMACLSRDIGASPAIEGATGVSLTAISLQLLIKTKMSGTETGAAVSTVILGIMLLIFLLF